MLGLITFDTENYTLDVARLSGAIVSLILLFLMKRIFKQRKYIRNSYYSPILIFTSLWLVVLFVVSALPLLTNSDVISSGPIFTLIAASYIWSLAGTGWLLSHYVKQFQALSLVMEEYMITVRNEEITDNEKAV